jgi:hypothetical protein
VSVSVHCEHLGVVMSRGYGRIQRFWLNVARGAGKPWTFDEICRSAFPECYEPGTEMRASFKRSLRRALREIVDDHNIIPLGRGGRCDPTRYCIHPQLLDADNPRRAELMTHLESFGFYWGPDGNLMLRHH